MKTPLIICIAFGLLWTWCMMRCAAKPPPWQEHFQDEPKQNTKKHSLAKWLGINRSIY